METSWLDSIDLKTQTLTFLMTGRVKNPTGQRTESVVVGKAGVWVDAAVKYDTHTGAYLLTQEGKVVRVLQGVYAVEVS